MEVPCLVNIRPSRVLVPTYWPRQLPVLFSKNLKVQAINQVLQGTNDAKIRPSQPTVCSLPGFLSRLFGASTDPTVIRCWRRIRSIWPTPVGQIPALEPALPEHELGVWVVKGGESWRLGEGGGGCLAMRRTRGGGGGRRALHLAPVLPLQLGEPQAARVTQRLGSVWPAAPLG